MDKPILSIDDKVFLIACSDGIPLSKKSRVEEIKKTLEEFGLRVELANTVFQKDGPFSGHPKERASELMRAFLDSEIKAIFDISGGNAANQVLEYLEFDIIKNYVKPFWGLSDLTVVLNSLFNLSGLNTYHYGLKVLVDGDRENQIRRFKEFVFSESRELIDFEYRWISGNYMKGQVIGGNLRCLCKLAGTKYMPDAENKLLLLESLGGSPSVIITLLTQLKYLGIYEKINGIILGTFSEMERNNLAPNVMELLKIVLDDIKIPIIKTDYVGHEDNGRCVVIGEEYEFD